MIEHQIVQDAFSPTQGLAASDASFAGFDPIVDATLPFPDTRLDRLDFVFDASVEHRLTHGQPRSFFLAVTCRLGWMDPVSPICHWS